MRARWIKSVAVFGYRAGKMELSCPFGTTRCVLQVKFARKPYNKFFIDQVCSVKMAGYWPSSFFASLWTSTPSRSLNTQKKNLANILPSWPHNWSITDTYCLSYNFKKASEIDSKLNNPIPTYPNRFVFFPIESAMKRKNCCWKRHKEISQIEISQMAR